ncbi:hypothetical protein ABMB44_15685 [Levilactobacillus brevis]
MNENKIKNLGEKTYGAWSAEQSFDAVKSPELKGYTADKAQIDKQTVNGDSKAKLTITTGEVSKDEPKRRTSQTDSNRLCQRSS